MSEAAGGEVSEEAFLGCVARICAADASLSPLAASVLAALHLEVCNDSRTFARLLGIEHALILREITGLAEDRGLLAVADRDARTQRTRIALTETAKALLARASAA